MHAHMHMDTRPCVYHVYTRSKRSNHVRGSMDPCYSQHTVFLKLTCTCTIINIHCSAYITQVYTCHCYGCNYMNSSNNTIFFPLSKCVCNCQAYCTIYAVRGCVHELRNRLIHTTAGQHAPKVCSGNSTSYSDPGLDVRAKLLSRPAGSRSLQSRLFSRLFFGGLFLRGFLIFIVVSII